MPLCGYIPAPIDPICGIGSRTLPLFAQEGQVRRSTETKGRCVVWNVVLVWTQRQGGKTLNDVPQLLKFKIN